MSTAALESDSDDDEVQFVPYTKPPPPLIDLILSSEAEDEAKSSPKKKKRKKKEKDRERNLFEFEETETELSGLVDNSNVAVEACDQNVAQTSAKKSKKKRSKHVENSSSSLNVDDDNERMLIESVVAEVIKGGDENDETEHNEINAGLIANQSSNQSSVSRHSWNSEIPENPNEMVNSTDDDPQLRIAISSISESDNNEALVEATLPNSGIPQNNVLASTSAVGGRKSRKESSKKDNKVNDGNAPAPRKRVSKKQLKARTDEEIMGFLDTIGIGPKGPNPVGSIVEPPLDNIPKPTRTRKSKKFPDAIVTPLPLVPDELNLALGDLGAVVDTQQEMSSSIVVVPIVAEAKSAPTTDIQQDSSPVIITTGPSNPVVITNQEEVMANNKPIITIYLSSDSEPEETDKGTVVEPPALDNPEDFLRRSRALGSDNLQLISTLKTKAEMKEYGESPKKIKKTSRDEIKMDTCQDTVDGVEKNANIETVAVVEQKIPDSMELESIPLPPDEPQEIFHQKPYFPSHWTKAMVDYYDSPPNMDFYLPRVIATLPDDSKLWELSETGFPRAKPRKGIRCFNCNQWGHLSRECTEKKKKMVCSLCGEQEYNLDSYMNHRLKCPKSLCLNCGKSLPRTQTGCEDCIKGDHPPKCTACNNVGHNSSHCPDEWRRYFFTTTLVKHADGSTEAFGEKPEYRSRKDSYCCNCCHKGHLAHRCPVPNKDNLYSIQTTKIINELPQAPKVQNSENVIVDKENPDCPPTIVPDFSQQYERRPFNYNNDRNGLNKDNGNQLDQSASHGLHKDYRHRYNYDYQLNPHEHRRSRFVPNPKYDKFGHNNNRYHPYSRHSQYSHDTHSRTSRRYDRNNPSPRKYNDGGYERGRISSRYYNR